MKGTRLQSSNESMKTEQKTKQKLQKERNNNKKATPEKYRGRALDRESLVKGQPRAIRYPFRIATMHPNAKYLQHSILSQGFFTAMSTSLKESLGWSNQLGSKASIVLRVSNVLG